MNGDSERTRRGLDKIVLMGLFVASLLIAHLVVVKRTALKLSKPIELSHSGLSVAVPTGNGWESQEKWQYQNNTYFLISDFNSVISEPMTKVICRYQIAAEEIPARTWFEQQAGAIDGKILETDQWPRDTLTINWAHIEKPELMLCMFIGTAELPFNRRLDIEVHQFAGETELARKVFREIINSVRFTDNQLLKAGAEIVSTIKSKGIRNLLNPQNRQSCLLIKNMTGQNVGFTIDILDSSNLETNQFDIQASGYLHLSSKNILEQRTFFGCADNLGAFRWQSNTFGNLNRRSSDIVLNEAGIMSIRIPTDTLGTSRFRPSPAAIPDIFLEQLFAEMLERNTARIMFEIIDSDGKITPVLAETGNSADYSGEQGKFAYAITLKLLDESGASEQVYFDSGKRIVKTILRSRQNYILERTDVEQLMAKFPDYRGIISQMAQP